MYFHRQYTFYQVFISYRGRRPNRIARWRRKLNMVRQLELAEAGAARPWPAERIEFWSIERLIPYAKNARLHTEADINSLVDSLRRWGWTNAVLVDEHGMLIAGHGRVRAAAKLGLTSIPVIIARGWSEEEKRAYR